MAPRILGGQLSRRLEHVADGMNEPVLLLATAIAGFYLSILAISALASPSAAALEEGTPFGIVGGAGEGYPYRH
jgi:hypothetical protein